RTPIVEAVARTRASVVAIKAQKRNKWGRTAEITGTGVLVDERGYLVTNGHIVSNAAQLKVRLLDETVLTAKVVVEEPRWDLAVLKVEAGKKLPALPLGPGSDLMVGERVIAVGNPYGYTNTVSTGIISALGRDVPMPNDRVLTNLIQTDASINP